MPAVLFKSGDLRGRRNETVAGHIPILQKGSPMRFSVGRRFLSGLKAGASTAQIR
ncbi:hypothetical protein FRACA_4220003 [Frankia canadensis]|uniref:Uncharacterized protein n=1 Tax=Frankia canadensis TaxID=1836972 RepID=A0A2I2KX50_9ACTN|nr:hypothetical protein FRACA_4220003 [Frankia canadensis]SOU57527.1 hypothetical protein FRACA_4220003 [Frankia canadensis]